MSLKIGESVEVPEDYCPKCNKKLDAATCVSEDGVKSNMPSPGDFSVCYGCCAILTFGSDLKVKIVTDEEMADLKCKHPDIHEALDRARKVTEIVRMSNSFQDAICKKSQKKKPND